MYAICHFLSNPLDEPTVHGRWGVNQKAHQESLLFDYARKNCNKNQRPNMQLITMERMIDTCIGVPDIDAIHPEYKNFKHHCFIFLRKRAEWNQIFYTNIKRVLEDEKDPPNHNSEEEDTSDEESEQNEEEASIELDVEKNIDEGSEVDYEENNSNSS